MSQELGEAHKTIMSMIGDTGKILHRSQVDGTAVLVAQGAKCMWFGIRDEASGLCTAMPFRSLVDRLKLGEERWEEWAFGKARGLGDGHKGKGRTKRGRRKREAKV